jgi:hypothetical protein
MFQRVHWFYTLTNISNYVPKQGLRCVSIDIFCLPLQLANLCWVHLSNHHDNPTISILQTSTKLSIHMSQIKSSILISRILYREMEGKKRGDELLVRLYR